MLALASANDLGFFASNGERKEHTPAHRTRAADVSPFPARAIKLTARYPLGIGETGLDGGLSESRLAKPTERAF
jgi:hypothetical protein